MSNWKKEEQCRREGMAYALEYAKKYGIDGLEKECKRRGALQLPVAIHPDTVNECLCNIKNQVFDTIYALWVLSMLDQYKEGSRYQMEKVMATINSFEKYSEILARDDADWVDVLDEIATRTREKIQLNIRLNNVNAKNHGWTRENHRKVGSV